MAPARSSERSSPAQVARRIQALQSSGRARRRATPARVSPTATARLDRRRRSSRPVRTGVLLVSSRSPRSRGNGCRFVERDSPPSVGVVHQPGCVGSRSSRVGRHTQVDGRLIGRLPSGTRRRHRAPAADRTPHRRRTQPAVVVGRRRRQPAPASRVRSSPTGLGSSNPDGSPRRGSGSSVGTAWVLLHGHFAVHDPGQAPAIPSPQLGSTYGISSAMPSATEPGARSRRRSRWIGTPATPASRALQVPAAAPSSRRSGRTASEYGFVSGG